MARKDLYRVEMKVEVEYKDFSQFYREYTKNISRGGLFIKTDNMLKPQTVIEVVLKLPDHPPCHLVGEVVHNLDPETARQNGWDPGIGIHFLDFKECGAQELEDYLREKYHKNPELRSPERRSEPRVPIRLKVKFPSLDVLHHDYSEDISRGGIFIQTQKPRKIGDRFLITLVHPETGQEIQLLGEVVRITEQSAEIKNSCGGMGIRFLEMDDSKYKQIEQFLKGSPAQTRPKA
jgi:type IV pilus assembly protein PilZ